MLQLALSIHRERVHTRSIECIIRIQLGHVKRPWSPTTHSHIQQACSFERQLGCAEMVQPSRRPPLLKLPVYVVPLQDNEDIHVSFLGLGSFLATKTSTASFWPFLAPVVARATSTLLMGQNARSIQLQRCSIESKPTAASTTQKLLGVLGTIFPTRLRYNTTKKHILSNQSLGD